MVTTQYISNGIEVLSSNPLFVSLHLPKFEAYMNP